MKVTAKINNDFIQFEITIGFENKQEVQDFFNLCLRDAQGISIEPATLFRRKKITDAILENCKYFKTLLDID